MTPTRVLPAVNKTPDYPRHLANIARIIAHAPNMNEVDIRVGYYMMVAGVTCVSPDKSIAAVPQVSVKPLDWNEEHQKMLAEEAAKDAAKLNPAAVDAVFAGPQL